MRLILSLESGDSRAGTRRRACALLSLLAPSSAVFLMRSPSFGAAYDLVANPFAHHYYQPSALWPSVLQFHNDFPLRRRDNEHRAK